MRVANSDSKTTNPLLKHRVFAGGGAADSDGFILSILLLLYNQFNDNLFSWTKFAKTTIRLYTVYEPDGLLLLRNTVRAASREGVHPFVGHEIAAEVLFREGIARRIWAPFAAAAREIYRG